MPNFPVHWHEGQFIRPHHFQASHRHFQEQLTELQRSVLPFAYGVRKIEISEEALVSWRFVLQQCQVLTFEGTLLRLPQEFTLPPLKLDSSAFDNPQRRARIFLCISSLNLGQENCAAEQQAEMHRHIVQTETLDDENMANNKQNIQVRRPHVRLVVGEDAASRYESIPLCQLRLAATEVATPEIDPDFVPPVLTLHAWPWLCSHLLSPIRDRYLSLAEELGREMNEHGVAFLAEKSEDLERILKLQALNAVIGSLAYIVSIGHIHPLTAYLELCRAVGTIAIFKPQRRIPNLPEYDHDDLGRCFTSLRSLLDLGVEEHPRYFPRDFLGSGLQLQVRLEREWLEPGWTFYIGVKSSLTLNEVDKLLRRTLLLKTGSTDEVDAIYIAGREGVALDPAPDPPPQLPSSSRGWTYWHVVRNSPSWRRVERTLHFGMRFNERQTKSRLEGRNSVVIHNPENHQLEELTFKLYAVPDRP